MTSYINSDEKDKTITLTHCKNQMAFCRLKCKECDYLGREEACPNHSIECGGDNIPSFKQWIQIYLNLAKDRNKKTGMLGKAALRHIIHTLNEFKTVMNFTDDDKVSVINRKTLSQYCDRIGGRGVTLRSKCQRIGQAFAKWVRHETEDNWVIPRIESPDIIDDSERFHEPSPEIMLNVKRWYRSLLGDGRGVYKNRDRLYAMFMYKYAMRNSDVDTLKWSNIENVNGRMRLVYIPHKTRLSSKRIIKIWMGDLDYADLMDFKKSGQRLSDEYIFGGSQNISLKNRLNKQIKSLGVKGDKGLYFLRKICIHMIFKKYGQEAASAISGDDFNTLKTHYCDPDSIEVSALEDGAF